MLMIMLLCSTTILLGTFSCGGSARKGKNIHIRHTQDWTEYVASATTIKEIDDGLASIPVDVFLDIFEDLTDIVFYETKAHDYESQKNCRAYGWMILYISFRDDLLKERASKEQLERFTKVIESHDLMLLNYILSQGGLGNSTQEKLGNIYADYVTNGNNQKLYY